MIERSLMLTVHPYIPFTLAAANHRLEADATELATNMRPCKLP
jgi:hypothetical protein